MFQRSNAFLLSKQNEDGGWGENYLSCVTQQYNQCDSTVVNTAWALLALMGGHCKDVKAVQRGVDYLQRRQQVTGDWPQELVSGIFNKCVVVFLILRPVVVCI